MLLGAGFDTRALRMPELAGARVFEIEHPATQGHKRAVLDRTGAASPAHYLTWDFEQRPLAELPAALAEAGCNPRERTFTIWEGVTMYLSERAIDASLRAIRTWSPPGSQVAIQYFTKRRLAKPSLATRVVQAVVARVGEPWVFGWGEDELAPYVAERGFTLVRDVSMTEAAQELLPASFARLVQNADQRIALVEVSA